MEERDTTVALRTNAQQAGQAAASEVQLHAQAAARAGKVQPTAARAPSLLAGLAEQGTYLERVATHFRQASETASLSHAAEWLLDNFFLAKQALRQVHEDMPAQYYRQLPVLAEGPLAGLPRVYDIAERLVTAGAARLDLAYVGDFIRFYQEEQPLTTGELWALPVMLRLSVLDALASALAAITGIPNPAPLPRPARESTAPDVGATLTDDERVGAAFTSLRSLAQMDWQRFFEAVSLVEAILRTDPSGLYGCMERETRDQYRKVVEHIAVTGGRGEQEVARAAVALAVRARSSQAAPAPPPCGRAAGEDADWLAPRAMHVGYYLIGEGRRDLETVLQYKPALGERLVSPGAPAATALYIGPVLLLTALFMLAALLFGRAAGATAWQQALIVILSLAPTLTIAVSIVNWLVTLLTPAQLLPKLDFEAGIPDPFKTLIVVPSMLTSSEEVQDLLRQMEIYWLGNAGANLAIALLTDYGDAAQQECPEDQEWLAAARRGVRELNVRYMREGAPPFYLLHRERRWNPRQDRWMGWERKRGKLHELNRWLRGARDTSFVAFEGALAWLDGVRYVITLDADTVLPRDAARRLIGTLAHPLNRAELDAAGRVVRGYGILQPRTEITPQSANYSRFSRIYAGDMGLDLYTHAVSNVYQDLFGSGIYVGKGIYDVDVFARTLAGRAPENALLSHDLFEGAHARTALVTDIVLYEDYPPSYLAYVRRLLRWTRGDWQLLPWLLPWAPGEDGRPIRNALQPIDTWKLLDNLRRSLLPLSLVLLFAAGWLVLPGHPVVWTLAALLAPSAPALLGSLTPYFTGWRETPWRRALRSLKDAGARWLLALVFLLYEAWWLSAAIGRTLGRLFITRRHLLDWTASAEAARQVQNESGRGYTWRRMRGGFIIAAGLTLLIAAFQPATLPVALPLLVGWLLAPEIAFRISEPIRPKPEPLTDAQVRRLNSLARRTWLFFERFVGPEDHWLPPDHYTEHPRGVSSPYTSPTNIGMLLLSTLGAYDLGFIGFPLLVTRLQYTFDTLARLERYRGHFLNWYDTRTLDPLPPRYISTVDSGNLAAALIVLRQALEQAPNDPLLRWTRWEALLAGFSLLDDAVAAIGRAGLKQEAEAIQAVACHLEERVLSVRDRPAAWADAFQYVTGEGHRKLEAAVDPLITAHGSTLGADALRALRVAIEAIRYQIFTLERSVNLIAPWMAMQATTPALLRNGMHPELAALYQELSDLLTADCAVGEATALYHAAEGVLMRMGATLNGQAAEAPGFAAAAAWTDELSSKIGLARAHIEEALATCHDLIAQAEDFFSCMEFGFLFEPRRQVFHIGYNATAGKLDDNFYDLLASEARIASIVALAKRDVPRSHWLHLSRPLTQVDGQVALLSWSATMFEYLMPPLLMYSPPGTLLFESEAVAVAHQIRYARSKGVPWGISESGYYAFDAAHNYQYRAFGVPGLGFKRNLAEDLVIAPYASLLALSHRPRAVAENVDALIDLGALGVHGFYESIDFTKPRLTLGEDQALVREYMAHHQGMILIALTNYFKDNVMVRRFHDDPRIHSIELLLQEKVPDDAPLEFPQSGDAAPERRVETPAAMLPWSVTPTAPAPEAHYLSNGRYGLFITAAGAGFSRWNGFDLTHRQLDATLEEGGVWLYIQDADSAEVWSATYQPVAAQPDQEAVFFHAGLAEFRRTDHGIALTTEIIVAPDDDVEIRRVTVVNESNRPRRLVFTSYAEVVIAPEGSAARHPAFNKLFIESEYLPEVGGLLFRRRPRAADDAPVYLVHLAADMDGAAVTGSYETDRAVFLGRGHTPRAPVALDDAVGAPLGGGIGATLDPIMALRRTVELAPGERRQISFLISAAGARDAAVAAAVRYTSGIAVENAFIQARGRAELELTQLGLSTLELQRIEALLSGLLHPHSTLRADGAVLAANTKGQAGLWAYGISGDYPLLFVRVRDEEDLGLIADLLKAHTYWRRRLLKIDLVILIDKEMGYSQELRNELQRLLARLQAETWLNQRGGIFILYTSQLPEADRVLLEAAARVVLDPACGGLAAQIEALHRRPSYLPGFTPEQPAVTTSESEPPIERPTGLLFDNGLGGFSPDGTEYVLYLEPGRHTPLPWSNVLANETFGSLVTESGASCTWAVNSGENRLTPWSNDPISDPSGEALYLRDEETGAIWSPMPSPCPAPAPYLVRHGQGYTTFEHQSHGLRQRLEIFVPPDEPIKILGLQLDNDQGRVRRVTVTFYVEWVLGVMRGGMEPPVTVEYDDATQGVLARNAYNTEFADRVAFVVASKTLHGLTTDRTEFLGRLGNRARPAGLARIGLSGAVEAGRDPCAALQVHLDLQPGQHEQVWFVLGQGANREEAIQLASLAKQPEEVAGAWRDTMDFWQDLLGAVQVETPEPALDLLLNRWLPYQTLACRIWGRSAFYQSSGAYGFRDQLQDVMAVLHTAPHIARAQILRAASHQFEAGDVLHWWHPPSGRGVRTRYSDDLLWLPFVTAHYVVTTGDAAILDEPLPFLRAAPLDGGEVERYGLYPATSETYSLYEHCQRAIEKGATEGAHGLPLMGGGDWNDGMNRVGIEGRGESVWLGWFLHATFTAFAGLSDLRGDAEQAAAYRERATRLSAALEAHAWDGDWYLRAFYDDGTPLGAAANLECRIDSIAQSWAVLSHAGDPTRSRQAMQAVLDQLVRWEDNLLLLFTPPFDQTTRDPGYIKGYLPGIRENGGQYTHAALWAVWAFADLGDGKTAGELFRLLNPIYHADEPEKLDRYKVEPYVVAADVYSVAPHIGRGGWTWYTGSSGWMHRLGLEGLLGVRREGEALIFTPHLPPEWPGYTLHYRYGDSAYRVLVHAPTGESESRLMLDGRPLEGHTLQLVADGRTHEVEIWPA